jgi:hypothetical protein
VTFDPFFDAACLVTSDQVYAQDIGHHAGKDSPPLQRTLKPNTTHPRFTGKVALLIGPENMSSC